MVTKPVGCVLPRQINVMRRGHAPDADASVPLIIAGDQVGASIVVAYLKVRQPGDGA